MNVTYNWLKEFVEFDFSPQELADRLTMVGLEVEGMTAIGEGLDSVIVAHLDKVETHPDADRLTVCQVNTGEEVVQVVCGATNHKSGDKVALARPGSVLPGDFKIKKSKIRGQESAGMLCSEKELGLATESAGIMILDASLPLGEPVFKALGMKDTTYEIGLTPNRPDCLSLVGIAREVAAMSGKPLRLPQPVLREQGERISQAASIEIEDATGCPRYAARLIRKVKIGPSPEWMVRRLESVGMRSINNVVDVTNYVMMELGHPMHAFDFRFLEGGKIVVKRATEGETFITLDDAEHRLSGEDLMICDGARPVAMAGVMGGQNSEVQADTETVLLEAAYFNPTSIRRTSKRHGLHTESSHRFERGADVDMVPIALDRAAALIAELAGGEIAEGLIDNYPQPLKPVRIGLSATRASRLLGVRVSAEQIGNLLQGIGLEVRPGHLDAQEVIEVSVPSFRPDLEREVDLIEEIARLYGYDRIPATMSHASLDVGVQNPAMKLEGRVRNFMAASGFFEVVNYSFVATDSASRLQFATGDSRLTPVPILNPLTEEHAVMRTTLVPSMLEVVERNLARRTYDLHLFELRPVFFPAENECSSRQELHLVAAISGKKVPLGWAQTAENVDFYDLKGIVERLSVFIGVADLGFDSGSTEPYLHPGKSARITAGREVLGVIGELHPRVQKEFDIDQPVYLFDLDMEAVSRAAGRFPAFQVPSRYPAVERDSALLIDEGIEAAKVLDIAQRNLGKFGQDIVIFDLYQGQGIPAGKKSLALRVRYGSSEKPLTEDEVAKAHGKLVKAVCHQLEAEIR